MSDEKYIKSSPYFFRMIFITMLITIAVTALLAIIFGAPLQEAAEPYHVPNPSKSAWFLLWMQELASYSAYLVYLIIFIYLFFMFMPLMTKRDQQPFAKWFDGRFRIFMVITIITALGIIALTTVAHFFRGEYWQLIL